MSQTILVLGAGTAGCAAAAFLRQHGLHVILVDRIIRPLSPSVATIGESLSPDASPLLKQLGIWDDFCAAPHLKCYGNLSYWHSSVAQHHDFLQHPVGHGWHLDRTLFDNQLLDHAIKAGAEFYPEAKMTSLEFLKGQWQFQLTNTQGQVLESTASFAIDATGRNSWLVRQQGVERLYEAEQLSLVNYLNISDDFDDSRTLVETTTQGWWYSAAIPGNRMVTAFFCDPELIQKDLWYTLQGWQQLLTEAAQTEARIQAAAGRPCAEPYFVAAHSSISERLHGPGWVAIGDAALTYDPIAAHGITMALTSARDAAHAIYQRLSGDAEALERYEMVLWAAFQRYAAQRQTLTTL